MHKYKVFSALYLEGHPPNLSCRSLDPSELDLSQFYLRSHNPEKADPPELRSRKHRAQHVA